MGFLKRSIQFCFPYLSDFSFIEKLFLSTAAFYIQKILIYVFEWHIKFTSIWITQF